MAIVYNTKIVRDGLSAHLDAANSKSFPGSGNSWKDISGNGRHFTIYGATHDGTYFTFDGVNDYCSTTGASPTHSQTTPETVELVFRMKRLPSAEYTDGMLYGHRFGDNLMFIVWPAESSVSSVGVAYDDSRYATSAKSSHKIAVDEWVHFTTVMEGTRLVTYYINGELDTNQFTISNATVDTSSFRIGRSDRDTGGNGLMYSKMDFAILRHYDAALTASEVKQNFNATRDRFGL
jgi:hypothetical protein